MLPFKNSWRLEELSVNYRTPAQIVASAEAMALAHGLTITQSTAVREGDWPVAIHRTDDLFAATVDAVREDRAIDDSGTVAVIASGSIVEQISAALEQAFGDVVGRGALGLQRSVAVLTPQESKGLEFDTAIVVEPQAIVDEITRGVAALYVSMTRPTQRLRLVTTGALPAGIAA